ncbi:MAG: DUF5661 family protein [Actinomycetota bacterium]
MPSSWDVMAEHLTPAEARSQAEALGLDLDEEIFGLEALRRGIEVEMEHGPSAGPFDLTGADPLAPAKIAVVHLRMCSDYYQRLDAMRRRAALEDAARAVEEEPGMGTVHQRSPCRFAHPARWGP